MTTQLVTADPVHLANIISNLLENAIKYSGSEVAISISCTLQAHTLTLAISDNGIGIPASEQSKYLINSIAGIIFPTVIFRVSDWA